MQNNLLFAHLLEKSTKHILSSLLEPKYIDSLLDSIDRNACVSVYVDFHGGMQGEIIYRFSSDILKAVVTHSKQRIKKGKNAVRQLEDIATELGNMITGTFVNHLQYREIDVHVSPPEVLTSEEKYLRATYESVELSFDSSAGQFEIALYYKF